MKKNKIIILVALLGLSNLMCRTSKLDNITTEAVKTQVSHDKIKGKKIIKVVKDTLIKEFDEPTFARIKNINFKDGVIEVKVKSRLLANAPEFARGFIGIAFRVNEDNSKFECIYLRPTNGRSENQLRRNRSIQYFSYPDFKFERLRKEAPSQYETYADMSLDEWIKMKIVVIGKEAKLFLNDGKQPSLIVSDLKHGDITSGAIGLWVDVGTEGYFKDLIITERK
jgi:hypothetical protein